MHAPFQLPTAAEMQPLLSILTRCIVARTRVLKSTDAAPTLGPSASHIESMLRGQSFGAIVVSSDCHKALRHISHALQRRFTREFGVQSAADAVASFLDHLAVLQPAPVAAEGLLPEIPRVLLGWTATVDAHESGRAVAGFRMASADIRAAQVQISASQNDKSAAAYACDLGCGPMFRAFLFSSLVQHDGVPF